MVQQNVFRQHVPSFVDVDERTEFEFSTTEELITHPLIQGMVGSFKNHKICKSKNYLMVVSDNGFWWWVLGYIKTPEEVDLPEWEGAKYDCLHSTITKKEEEK